MHKWLFAYVPYNVILMILCVGSAQYMYNIEKEIWLTFDYDGRLWREDMAVTKTYVTHSPYNSIYRRYKQYWVHFIFFFTYTDYIFPCKHGNLMNK